MRTEESNPNAQRIQATINLTCKRAFANYKRMIDLGCPRELARAVLPVAAYSKMFATIDLHNLLHFLTLRCHSHAQYEIRVYAEAMLALIEPVVPVTIAAFKELQNA
jgi:thymidylate synthase (FAD)